MVTPTGVKKRSKRVTKGSYSGSAKRSLETEFDSVGDNKKQKLIAVKVEKD